MYLMTRKKIVIPCLAILIVVSVIVLYILQTLVDLVPVSQSLPELYIIKWDRTDTISCHNQTEGNSLTAAEDIAPPPDSIFFHETSCRGGLNSRQACAVESAARLHPERNIYVFFNAPISKEVLRRSCLSKLQEFENVKLARLHSLNYSQGTVLGDMMADKETEQSNFKIEHTADLLRYITMFKYGGVYLDTDILVVKRLEPLGKNWAARQDDTLVNVAAMAIDPDKFGHELVTEILASIQADYRPYEWVYNGPGAMTRALLKFCNTDDPAVLSADICNGFQVYGPEVIYPVHFHQKDRYFNVGQPLVNVSKAYTHHLWNRLTFDMPVLKDSPYERLARKHCPTIRALFGENFGL